MKLGMGAMEMDSIPFFDLTIEELFIKYEGFYESNIAKVKDNFYNFMWLHTNMSSVHADKKGSEMLFKALAEYERRVLGIKSTAAKVETKEQIQGNVEHMNDFLKNIK